MTKRPWYHLYRKTWLALAAAALALSPLVAGVLTALIRSRREHLDANWAGPLEFMAIGLLVFCLAVLLVVAAVAERWQRLQERPKPEEEKRY